MIVAATGHRPSKLGGHNATAEARVLQVAVQHFHGCRPATVISGMAQGWDMAVAEAAIMHDIPLICAVPFVGQEAIWPAVAQRRYNIVLACAKEVVIVSEGGYDLEKFQKRNQWMVDRADLLIALWNGDKRGGAYNCLRYAEKVGKPFDNLWSKYLRLGVKDAAGADAWHSSSHS